MSLVYRAVILGQMGLTPDPDPVNTVNVAPGVSSAFINGLPAGTLIQFANGTYQGLSLLPKAGQIFRGNPANPAAVVLQGTGNFRAFHGGSGNAPDVAISGLTITGYQSGMGGQFVPRPTGQAQDAKAQIGALEYAGPDWAIEDCRIVANYCTGLRMGGGTRVSRCTIADNGHAGILVGRESNLHRAQGTVIEDTTIAGNCRFDMNKTWDSGGIKYVGGATPGGLDPALLPARNNVLRRCIITANNGPGVWWDWDVLDGEIHHCSIFANHASGIVLEGSATAHIHHNQIGDNCTGSLPALVTFRCCALGVQNSKKCLIEDNLFVVTRANSMALTQHNRATGTVDTPQGGVYVGWFTGTENQWRGNVYLLLANGPFVQQFATHSCGNPNVAGTGVSCSFMCGTSQTGCNISSTPTGPTLGGNYLSFIPQPGDDHHNVSQGNTYRIASGSPAQWPFETGATVLPNPASYVPDWQQLPAWSLPPGKT
jgi:hypothetical protein